MFLSDLNVKKIIKKKNIKKKNKDNNINFEIEDEYKEGSDCDSNNLIESEDEEESDHG